ncbi:ABC transporter substrate-binding protein [Nicoletella semolina]|nr:ABC transporter substrate-binding protein [Nicoletella semolina]
MKLGFSVIFGCLPFQLLAHPHSFLDMKNQVRIEQGKLKGFAMSWRLDEITSSELIYEINSSKDKSAAREKILEELKQSLVQAHYFSEFYDKQNQPVKFKSLPETPTLRIEHNRIIYDFFLPVAKPPQVAGQRFKLFTFEPSYYLYMGYESKNDVSSSDPTQCQVVLEEAKVNQSLRLYASKLDRTETPDMPLESGGSLGAQFAQKVNVICQ